MAIVRVILILGALGGVVAFLLSDSEAFVYSRLVDEVMTDPEAVKGRELRVEGELKPGSVQFRENPCEWRFVLTKSGQEMPVEYPRCVVPDTFRDGMGISVTVQGQLGTQGEFLANQVIPRCPSKYDMKERMKNGEEMPHGGPLLTGSAGLGGSS